MHTGLRRPGVPGPARPALRDGRGRRAGGRRGLRRHRAVLGERRASRAGWPSTRPATSAPACTSRATGAAAPATSSASRSPARRRGGRAGSSPPSSTPTDEKAFAAWLADPAQPKALHDAKGPLLAFAARGWELAGVTSDTALSAYLAMPDQRSYDLADLVAALPAPRAARRGRRRRAAVLRRAGRGGGRGGRRASGRAPCSTSPTRWTPSSRPRPRPGCCATSSCRWSTCSPRWSAPASPSTPTTSARSRRSSAAR